MDDLKIDLPLIINGRSVLPEDRPDNHIIKYETGVTIRIPVMLPSDLAEIQAERGKLSTQMSQLTTDEVALFLHAAGDNWMTRRAAGRRLANAYAHRITGFSPAMVQADYETIGHFMTQRFHTWDTIAAEFGNERIFDEWIPNQMCLVRAFPRGLLLQYLVGNLPLAGLYSLLRGIITRNINLLKLPSRDLVTVLGMVQTMIATNPEHPISRSLSVAYWPHDSEIGDECLASADAVCIWGGGTAVEAVKRKVRANVPVSEFGPRWSVSLVDLTACDPDEAALRLVEDVGFYDQEACFNTQRAFIKGDIGLFRSHLSRYFDLFAERYPLGSNRDSLAHRSATLLEARYLGHDVDGGDDWAIISIAKGVPDPAFAHPLGRTLILSPVEDFTEALPYLNSHIQTVSLMPSSLAQELRDELAWAGANRIVDLGWSRMPRQGFTHDGVFGMHPLVRLVMQERTRYEFGKYYPAPSNIAEWQKLHLQGQKWWEDVWWTQMEPDPAGDAEAEANANANAS
jgi:long-chain-fatty-acyl-CoA reductase